MAQQETTVYIRFRVQQHTVDPETTARFIQEFVMEKFSFIEACEPLVGELTSLVPDEARCLTRADRPVQAQPGEAN